METGNGNCARVSRVSGLFQKLWKVMRNVVMSGSANQSSRIIKAGMWDRLGVSGFSDIWLPLMTSNRSVLTPLELCPDLRKFDRISRV